MIDYELILIFSACGFIWSEVLTREGMILGWVGDLVNEAFDGKPLGEYMKKPIYSCAVCVTGFWSFPISLYLLEGSVIAFIYPILSMLLTKILLRYT